MRYHGDTRRDAWKTMIDNEWLFLTERPAYDAEREN